MTIKELEHIWYNGDRSDIDFCLLCSALVDFIDLQNGKDVETYLNLTEGIRYALEDLLNDYK